MNPQSSETIPPPEAPSTTSHGGHPAHASRPSSKFLVYTVPAIFLILLACMIFWRVQARQRVSAELIPASKDANTFSVAAMHPKRGNANEAVQLPGNVQAYVETPIYARTNGYLRKWYVDIGGRVKAGELLAAIETPEVDQQLRQAQAAQLQAQANLDLAKTTADRWQNLLKSDGVSQQEVDQNVSAYKARQADFAAAAANVDRLKYLQSFQQVTAPFAGVLTARNVDIGALIADGNVKPLFQLAQTDILRVYVNVPEGYTSDIHIGMPAELHIAEIPGRVFTGKITHTAGAIDVTSRTLLTEVQVPNPKGELLPGTYAQVIFHIKEGSAPLVVPSNALIFRSGGAQVALVGPNNTARLKSVTIGRDFGTSLEIVSGLTPEDTVILNPPDSLMNGMAVSLQAVPAASSTDEERQKLPQDSSR